MVEVLSDLTRQGQSAFNFWLVTSVPTNLPQGVIALDIVGDHIYYRRPNGTLMSVKLNAKPV